MSRSVVRGIAGLEDEQAHGIKRYSATGGFTVLVVVRPELAQTLRAQGKQEWLCYWD
jgi:hypothetical protein